MFSGVGKQMVNAEFSRIYRFVKLLVNEGFLAVDRWLLRMTKLGCQWYQSDQCGKLFECFPKDPPEIVAPKACIYFLGSL